MQAEQLKYGSFASTGKNKHHPPEMPGLVRNITTTIHELASLIRTLQSTVEAVVPAALYVKEQQMHQTNPFFRHRIIKQKYHWHLCRSGISLPCIYAKEGKGGKWNAQGRQHHINALELKVAEIALILSLVKNKSKIHVHLKMNKTTSVSYVNKMGVGEQTLTLTKVAKKKYGNFVLEGRSLLLQSTYQVF